MNPSPYQLVRMAAFMVSVFIMVCVMGEVGARILRLNPTSLITLDPCVGYISFPNAHGLVAGPAGLVAVETNSAGFRDVEHSYEKPRGVYRVLFLGDSFTEAQQVPLQETFGRQLQQKADDAHLKIEIITMGVSSWGTGQEVLAYECFGRRYHPDLVVLDFNGDDLLDNYFRSDPFTPTFHMEGGALILDTQYKENIEHRVSQRATLFPGAFYYLRDHSTFLRYLLLKIGNASAGAHLADVAGSNNPTLPEYEVNQTPAWEAAWNVTAALVKRLADDVRTDHAHLLVVHMPTLVQFTPPNDIANAQYDLRLPNKKIAAIATQLHIPVLDLYDLLGAAQRHTDVHWTGDPHLTAAGHQITADALFHEVLYLRHK